MGFVPVRGTKRKFQQGIFVLEQGGVAEPNCGLACGGAMYFGAPGPGSKTTIEISKLKKMTQTASPANYGFSVREHNGRYDFQYAQEKYRGRDIWYFFIPIALLSLLLLAAIEPSSATSGFLLWLVISVCLFYSLKYLMNRSRNSRSFAIDSETFEVGGVRYPRREITSLYWQKGNAKPVLDVSLNQGVVIAYPATVGGVMAASAHQFTNGIVQLNEAAAQKVRDNMARLNCKVCIRYGNRKVLLAKGILPDTAELMVKRIEDVCSK